MAYTISIDEEQRKYIERALRLYDQEVLKAPEYLIEMWTDLPKEEKDTPGIIHGLCF